MLPLNLHELKAFILMLAKIIFILTTFLLSSSHALSPQDICASETCVGVVDAGSSGSRLHVYAYKSDPLHGIKEVWSKHIGPGFASLQLSYADVDAYLTKLFSDAPIHIPVYFYATAGMRLLSSDAQEKYFDTVKRWFKLSAWNLQEVKTLTGREEAVFAWLSVYYSLHSKYENNTNKLAILDTGGASVQIVVPVTRIDESHAENYVSLKLDGKPITLFAYSFLGLGRNLIIQQFLNDTACYANDYQLPNKSKGRGNTYACSQHITTLINEIHAVNKIVQPVLQNTTQKDWYVLGGLSFHAKSAYMQSEESFTSKDLAETAKSNICHRSWPDVQADYPEEFELFRACFTASYYYALLTQGYGLSPATAIHLMPPSASSNWTLGVLLRRP